MIILKKILLVILFVLCSVSVSYSGILLSWEGNTNDQIEMPVDNPLGMPTSISEDIAHWAYPPRLRDCIVNAALNDGQVPPVWGVVSGYGGGPAPYYGTHMIRLKKFSQTECASLGCENIGFDRAELYLDSRQTAQNLANLEDKVYWFGWSVYIPSSFPHIPSRTFILSQFHVAGCLGTFPVSGQDYETAVNWDAGYTALTATSKIRWNTDYCTASLANGGLEEFPFPSAITFDTWHTWVIKIRPNQTNQAVSGEFKAWWDGTQYANYTGNVGRPTDKGMAPLFPSIYIGNQVDDGYTAIIYYDSITIGDENSSYDEVFPGTPTNQAPTVTMTPGTTQTIAQNDNVNFSCVPADSDGTIASILWDFDDSGISQDTNEDPGNKQFTQVGTFNVRVTVTDNDGATAYDEVTVIVGAGGVTGLISNHDFESGAEGTDNEANMAYTINGGAVVEGVGTEPNPPGYGTVGLVLDGTNDYVSAASYHASAPWQTGQAVGTFIIAYKTPGTTCVTSGDCGVGETCSTITGYCTPSYEIYLGGRYNDTLNQRTVGFLIGSSTGLQPWMKIGYNSGASHEDKYQGVSLSPATRYCTIFRIDATQKLWKIDTYNYDTTTWLASASGSITNDMNLAGTAAWELGRRSSGAYFDGVFYYDFLYNTWLTDGEIVEIAEGTYEEPPVQSNVIDSMCFASSTTGACYTSDQVFHTGQDVCVKVTFGFSEAYTFTGSYNDFYWPFTLDSGTLTLRYRSGFGTNQWLFCDRVTADDVETEDITLSAVTDFVKGSTTIVNQSGTEITSYNAPATDFDSKKYKVVGPAHVWFSPSE